MEAFIILLLLAAFMYIRNSTIRRKTPLKRSRKRIPKRGKRYRAKDNIFKAKLYGCTTQENWDHAHMRREGLLARRTVPEKQFEATLSTMGPDFAFEPQSIVMSQYGEYRIVDIRLRHHKVIFEIIGGYHNDQRPWDAGRLRWIQWVLPDHKVIEMTNREVMAPRLAQRIQIAMNLYRPGC